MTEKVVYCTQKKNGMSRLEALTEEDLYNPATLNVPPEMVFHSTETIKATIVYFRIGCHIIPRNDE